jgi:hypothetical protein
LCTIRPSGRCTTTWARLSRVGWEGDTVASFVLELVVLLVRLVVGVAAVVVWRADEHPTPVAPAR